MNAMKKVTLIVTCAIAASLFMGCDRIKQLEAENRTLSARLEKQEQDLNQAQIERDQLREELAESRKALEDKEAMLASFGQSKQELIDTIEQQKKLIAELQARGNFKPLLPQELDAALKEFAEANPDLVTFDSKNGMVKLKSDLTFDPGSTTVKPSASQALDKLSRILNSAQAKTFCVYIAGHTDDMPIAKEGTRRRHPDNWYLSVHRAVGVEKALVKGGVYPSRLAVMGFGEYHPVAPNKAGKRGNELNRRVELWIVPQGTFLTDFAK